MGENKITKEIYINASKVSHFTNFNRYTKENEDIEILYEHNSWLHKFFHFIYQDPISEIINNLGDLKISSIKQDLGVSDLNGDGESEKESEKEDLGACSNIKQLIVEKIDDKIKEAIKADYENSKITIKTNEKLEHEIEKIIMVERGTYFESKDIKNLNFDIKIDRSLKKKQLFEFEHNNIIYKIIIGGRIDGYVNETTILETKHRRDRLFYFIPQYEMVQMEMYLYILDLKKCIHVENFQGLQNITEYVHDDDFLNEIKNQMKQYLIEFLDKYIVSQNTNTIIKTNKKQALKKIKENASKDQLIKEFEKYVQTITVNEINRKELFDDLSKLYNFNRNDAWVWLKEFNSDKQYILKYR